MFFFVGTFKKWYHIISYMGKTKNMLFNQQK